MKQSARIITRRGFLVTSVAACLALGSRSVTARTASNLIDSLAVQNDTGKAIAQSTDRAKRVADIIEEYDSQGFHRTGTVVDRVCALWLAGRIQQLGFEAVLEKFPLSRVDPVQAYLQIGQRRVEGVPFFDGTFTDASGIKGKLGFLGTEADIAVAEISPLSFADQNKKVQAYRRSGQYKAIIAITRGNRPGLTLVNAPDFTSPFGLPVLQVSSEDASWLEAAAKQGSSAKLVVQVKRTDVDAFNVTATLKGEKSSLAPLVVLTPRSGWWNCAAERGGGIACWLEVMGALSGKKLARDVVFVATSGHELGGLGLQSFLMQHSSLAKAAKVWFHLGANIGAAVGGGSILFASTEELQKITVAAMSQADTPPDERIPPGSQPQGEALLIHQRGGRYISLIGRNELFHHPEDRWPSAVNVDRVTRFATAFANLAITLARESDR